MSTDNKTFVLSLGGSLVVPNGGIDTKFLIAFNTFIRNQISSKKRRFFIVVGGGGITRQYQRAARDVTKTLVNEDLDWLGIHATRLNAHLIRVIFQDLAHTHVIKHYEIILKAHTPIVVAAGWKPGWSTDYCAVTICQDYRINTVINMTNIDQLYEKDPNKFSNAKPIDNISWKDYRKMAGDRWVPGSNHPFDPIASKLAQELGITVKLLGGHKLTNLAKALDGEKFFGTLIQ